jgi:phosphohistidine phosphatase SixA
VYGVAGAAEDWSSITDGTVVLFRHALAPGVGDPPGHTLSDCATQRNLSDEGKAQARRIGAEFRQRRVQVGAVWSSQWCRTRDTADLAFPGQRTDQPVFNSFFDESDVAGDRTRAAQSLLSNWRGPGVLVVVTHQVNITSLTGVVPSSGEGVVVKPSASGVKIVGFITP